MFTVTVIISDHSNNNNTIEYGRTVATHLSMLMWWFNNMMKSNLCLNG